MAGNICFVPLEGGESASIVIPNPAAGANFAYTVPAGEEWEIRTLMCILTTSIVAGNRNPRFHIYDSLGNPHWLLYFTVPTLLSEQSVFSLYVGCQRADYNLVPLAGFRHANDALPFERLLSGFEIGSNFVGLDIADQFSGIRMFIHRWRV